MGLRLSSMPDWNVDRPRVLHFTINAFPILLFAVKATAAIFSSSSFTSLFCPSPPPNSNNMQSKTILHNLFTPRLDMQCRNSAWFPRVVKLLAYISDKDLFAEFYRKKLAQRQLFDRSANDDHERKPTLDGELVRLEEINLSESLGLVCYMLTPLHYNGTRAYAQSKLASILHAKEISKQLKVVFRLSVEISKAMAKVNVNGVVEGIVCDFQRHGNLA
ncbi:hypothetical protein Q3G72_010292 [Acer saccharum]|nr:hypothetical protein Q3G72_010292 [Acer saccharum]